MEDAHLKVTLSEFGQIVKQLVGGVQQEQVRLALGEKGQAK